MEHLSKIHRNDLKKIRHFYPTILPLMFFKTRTREIRSIVAICICIWARRPPLKSNKFSKYVRQNAITDWLELTNWFKELQCTQHRLTGMQAWLTDWQIECAQRCSVAHGMMSESVSDTRVAVRWCYYSCCSCVLVVGRKAGPAENKHAHIHTRTCKMMHLYM